MAIISQTLYSGLAATSYTQINDLIGQFLAVVQNDPNVTIVSDNNPATTVARVITWSVGDSLHYFQMRATSGTAVQLAIRKLGNASDAHICKQINSSNVWTDTSCNYSFGLQNRVVRFMYSANIHLPVLWTGVTGINLPSSNSGVTKSYPPAFVKQSNGSWAVMCKFGAYSSYNSSNYYYYYTVADIHFQNGDDVIRGINSVAYSYRESSGLFTLSPARIFLSGVMEEVYPSSVYGVNSGMTDENFYNDGTLNYYYTNSGQLLYSE